MRNVESTGTRQMRQGTAVNMARTLALYGRLLGYLRPYRAQFLASLVAMMVFGATDGAVPYILKRVLDDVFGGKNRQLLMSVVAIIMVFAIVRGLFGFLERYLIARVGLKITEDVRNDIARQLLRQSPSFFSNHSSGALLARMTNDTLLVRTALTDAAGSILRDVVRVIALAASAIYLDPLLGAISLIGFPLALLPIMKFGKKVRRFTRQGQREFGGLTHLLQELILGNRVVQAFTQEERQYRRFSEENAGLTRSYLRAEKYGAMSGPTNEVCASFAIAAVILYGGLSVMSGVRTQGEFIAFIAALFLMYEPLKKLGRVNTIVQTGLSASERIFEILDAEPDIIEAPDAIELRTVAPRVEFRQVSFTYPAAELPGGGNGTGEVDTRALRDLSLVAEPGQTVALVGLSGSGKSTLVSLIPRFYDVQSGAILIDGLDVRRCTLYSLRSSLAVVTQHTFLFNDTVRANIGFGRPDATDEEIQAAAEAAHAHDFIVRLPEGYDTLIGEQGFRLSGGERARLAIARALLRNAPLLILDEATASLDSESEQLVQSAVELLMRGRTVFVIAHRLSTVRNADLIVVLNRGRIVESGTHEQLLARGGEYAKLCRLQFADERGYTPQMAHSQ